MFQYHELRFVGVEQIALSLYAVTEKTLNKSGTYKNCHESCGDYVISSTYFIVTWLILQQKGVDIYHFSFVIFLYQHLK